MSGQKDSDRLILEAIDNETDFLNLCITNKYFYSLCDETLFMRRMMKKYPEMVKYKENMTYKKLYLFTLSYIDKLKYEYNFNFTKGNPVEYYKLLSSQMFRFWKIREAIKEGYTDLAIFLSDQENTNNRLFTGLMLLAAKTNNKTLIDYYYNRENFEPIKSYEIISRSADIQGHFELSDYIRSLKFRKIK